MTTVLQAKGPLPGSSYKLQDGSYGMDVAISGDMDVDEKEMSLTIPFANGRIRDGVGDLLEIGGIRLERHRANPVVLFDHGKQVALPLGVAEDRKTKAYTVNLDTENKIATGKAFFYQGTGLGPDVDKGKERDHALFCEQVFDLMAKRYVRGGSIGYQHIHHKELPPDYDRGTPKGLHLISVLMLEMSAVVMPANPDTVRKALCLPGVCGRPMSPVLVKSLSAYVPANQPLVIGFADLMGEKALPRVEDTKIPPARWKPGVGASNKKLQEIRLKYRKSKGLRRRTKKSVPGSSVLYVRGKDLHAVKQEAGERGLKFAWVGTHASGAEKVRLTGDDGIIDGMAKKYGRPTRPRVARKSVSVKSKEGAGMGEMDDTDDVMGTPKDVGGADGMGMGEEAPREKYSLQVLRRMHEDASILMEDYHEMLGLMENPEVAAYIEADLGALEGKLGALEDLVSSHHPDVKDFGGMSDSPHAEEDAANADEDVTESEDPEDSEASAEVEDPVESNSRDDEEPTEEEAFEGTQRKALTVQQRKDLRSKYARKCADCGKPGCKCGSKSAKSPGKLTKSPGKLTKLGGTKGKDADDEYKKDMTDDEAEEVKDKIDEQSADTEEAPVEEPPAEAPPPPPTDDAPHMKSLSDEERGDAREAHGFLKELGDTRDFGDEHRMKSYHYHKVMEKMGMEAKCMETDPPQPGPCKDPPPEGGGGPGMYRRRGTTTGSSSVGQTHHADAPEEDKKDDEEDTEESKKEKKTDKKDMPMGTQTGGIDFHPHRKSCQKAGHFFKGLSAERAYGDNHRAEAMEHWKAMEEAVADPMPEEAPPEMPPDAMPPDMAAEPGMTDEKALALIYEKQRKALDELSSKVLALTF